MRAGRVRGKERTRVRGEGRREGMDDRRGRREVGGTGQDVGVGGVIRGLGCVCLP